VLGGGFDDASILDKLEDRRKIKVGKRVIESGVSKEGKSRVVTRCNAKPGTENPLGYSLKYV
jgi:hypothetical protein